ncbi:MAG: hypothetical protein DMENIID0003_01770 [Wolbachia endosymbiont of Sergentomyia squamirostris]|uniref:Uncharacterized protein n=1 Tax=Wolbachia endosymbiont of Sergentomyia squamirostris TaxID=3113640 RepID=A0AAT9GB64_9RICK
MYSSVISDSSSSILLSTEKELLREEGVLGEKYPLLLGVGDYGDICGSFVNISSAGTC